MNIDKWIQLNSQSVGRDKLARVLQYAARFVWDSLESKNSNPNLVDNFKTIEYIFSTFRKLLRFGKCLDVFYSSLHSLHYPDLVVRVSLTLSKLSQALFLLSDHFMWLARTGLFNSIDAKKWATTANKYWLMSIIMNLCRDAYEIFRLIDLHKASCRSGITRCQISTSVRTPQDFKRLALQSYVLLLSHKDLAVDTIKNVCDFFIPLTALGYTTLTPRTIGLLGVVSSFAGLWALIEPTAKLTPA